MKVKSRTEVIDEIAVEAMKAILHSIYLSPQMLITISEAASHNQQSASLEVAERAYLMAHAMVKKKMTMNSEEKPTR